MKKLLPLLLAAAMALVACGDGDGAPRATAETAAEAAAGQEGPAFMVGQLYRITEAGYGRGYNTGDAYYEIVQTRPGGYGGLLLKTDYRTMTQAPVCQRKGCTHDDATCPAYLPIWERHNVFVADGSVYIVYTAMEQPLRENAWSDERWQTWFDEQGIVGEEAEAYLASGAEQRGPGYIERIAPDGLSRERVVTLPDDIDWNVDLSYCDGKALYGVCGIYDTTAPRTGYRVDLSTGQVDSFALFASENFVGVRGSRMLTTHTVTDEPLPPDYGERYDAAMQNARVEFDLLDMGTGNRVKVCEFPYDQSMSGGCDFLTICGDRLYFTKTARDEDLTIQYNWVECFDIATGETRRVFDPLPTNQTWPQRLEGFLPIGSGETNPYFTLGAYNAGRWYLLNAETGEQWEMPQRQFRYGAYTQVYLLAQTNDGRWMVGYRPHGGDTTSSRSDYGLIAPEAFLAGSEEYEPVEMWP